MLTIMTLTGLYQIYRKTTGKELKFVTVLTTKIKSLNKVRKAKVMTVCITK